MTAQGVQRMAPIGVVLKKPGRSRPDGVCAGRRHLAAPPEIGDSWHALVADPTPPALAERWAARPAR